MEKKRFLFAVEGEKDEPNYIDSFFKLLNKNETINYTFIIKDGEKPSKIFERFQKLLRSKGHYTNKRLAPNIIPCIFVDVDSNNTQDMQKLIADCKKAGFHLFISHECFEQWLQYHINNTKIKRSKNLKEQLGKELGGERFTKISGKIIKAYNFAKNQASSSDDINNHCLNYTGSDIWRFLDLLKEHFPALGFEEL